MAEQRDLSQYQRVVIDQDLCISCGACVAVCPWQALELDENAKARLIWEKCYDDFSCVAACPVKCIYKASEAPDDAKKKPNWYRLGRQLSPDEQKILNDWKAKFGIPVDPLPPS
ncbi:MAG: DUF362 domain-containing protein [Thermoproteus sp.]|jgi:ferredoxin